jgi:hypothetical protein
MGTCLEKVIYECDYGKAEYYPHCEIATQVVNQDTIYKYSHTITVTRTDQWPKIIKELKSNSALGKSQSAFKAREMTKKIYSAADDCYVKMMSNFEKFYESFSKKALVTLKGKFRKEKEISALIDCFYKELINNAADSLAERLGDEQAPPERTLKIKMKVKAGQFTLEVKDDGIGLTAERVTIINTNSYASDKTGKMWMLGGTKKGLLNARREAATCQGTIEIQSKGINRGATVKLSIPLAQ